MDCAEGYALARWITSVRAQVRARDYLCARAGARALCRARVPGRGVAARPK
jgi:hypothetical protein